MQQREQQRESSKNTAKQDFSRELAGDANYEVDLQINSLNFRLDKLKGTFTRNFNWINLLFYFAVDKEQQGETIKSSNTASIFSS